ncbi:MULTISPECIES: glycosyltransferase family 4 protein [Saccharothrix]|uniref:glycosyltransferase family 4 protein n=1 Tax=Saccharothrix TaxID=2071 RepID=UPI0009400221|nr:glycosyltransferase family 4 protein [Saccharothrix sp. CB00851]OKI19832.1 hypothetical protein A6A25_38760 [Saccharothrix sp. CB00851]
MPFEDATEGVTVPVTVAFVELDGGAHRDVGLLARGLARLGHHVVHYAPTHQAPPGPGRYEQVRMAGGEDGTAGSSDRWELGRADVVHAFGVRSTATARAMIAESAIPLVADWCSYATAAHPVPEADHYTVTGKAAATALASRGVARSDIGIVVDTVDDELRRTQNETSAAAGRPRLLCHSRLRPEDGTDTAIAALRWLPEAELVVVHGGTVTSGARAEVTRLLDGARKLGVADRMREVDRHSLIAERLIDSADVVVHVPRVPGPVTPVLEAMARGKPVIASTTGDLSDTVIAGVTGLLVGAGDPAALGRAARRLLGDRTARAPFAVAALDRVEQRHTPTRVATDLHRIYRDILDRCRIGAGGTREALLAVASDPVLEAQTDPSWSGEGRRLPIAPSRSGGRCG